MNVFRFVALQSTFAVSLFAQGEFVINSRLDSTQRDPQIVLAGSGAYTVVWKSINHASATSRGDIVLQRFSSTDATIGGEILVNQVTAGEQERPRATMNAKGDLVVAWSSFVNADSMYDIKARLFPAGGGSSPEFLVNTTCASTQTNPAVAIDSAGNFVVLWDSWFQDLSDKGVYGQRFNAAGQKIGGEFQVNVTTQYSQARPAVCFLRDGRFVAIWESWCQDAATPSGYGMYGRIWNANGTPAGGEFQLNTYTNDYQWLGDLDALTDTTFVAVWCSWKQDGSDGGIVAQRFTASGTKIGSEILVNTNQPYYQWLPKVRVMPGGGFAVVWSSWKQDGSREGVFCQLFDKNGRKTSFETQVNRTTESFQWEPSFIPVGPGQILVTWASWGQTGHDYDIVGRRVSPRSPQGMIAPSTYVHTSGRTTASILVRVVDSLALTGQTYQVSFDTLAGKRALASIQNTATGDTVVKRFPLDKGEGMYYLTPVFEGVAVEFSPEFDMELNTAGSTFVNHSGTNLGFLVTVPGVGTSLTVPVDIALIWGKTDTLGNGMYASALDTAIGTNGVRNVALPFRAWNLTENAKVDMLVIETNMNGKWDAGERLAFRTPPPYRVQTNNMHAELVTTLPAGLLTMPAPGDTNYILTTRPLQTNDRFTFTTVRSAVLDAKDTRLTPHLFALQQNYPNPFNPVTALRYQLPTFGKVTLVVYDILGRAVATLVDIDQDAGSYSVRWDARAVASGVYFAVLKQGSNAITRKMMVIK